MKQLRGQVSKLGISVSWIGKKKHSEIHRVFQVADCFAEYIVRLGKNKELVRTLGNNARTNVLSRFTWRQTSSRLEAIY